MKKKFFFLPSVPLWVFYGYSKLFSIFFSSLRVMFGEWEGGGGGGGGIGLAIKPYINFCFFCVEEN